jgi:hypothetical protein
MQTANGMSSNSRQLQIVPFPKDRLLCENVETEKEWLAQLTNVAVDDFVLHLRSLPHHGVRLPHRDRERAAGLISPTVR